MTKSELQMLTDRVVKKYAHVKAFVKGTCEKKLPGVAVAGERGLGKSWTIQEVLAEYEDDRQIVKISGHITPLAMYNKLYEYRSEDCIIWFDDCDSAFTEKESLNILKAAMDTLPKRIVSWASSSSLVEVPEFEFKGRVIISTNVKLGTSPHLAAFLDRVHWFGISLTIEEKFVKISEIAKDFPDQTRVAEVLEWIQSNLTRIGKLLSLRTFVKVLGLASFSPDWRELAENLIEQDINLAKEAEEELLSKMKKAERGGKSVGTGKKGSSGPRTYKEGSAMWTLFERLKDGKPQEKSKLLAAIKKMGIQNPESRLDILAKHGVESGGWQIEMKGNTVQMKPGA